MSKRVSINEVLKRFKKIHGDKYDYSKVDYIHSRTKVEIICPEHGSFFQEPVVHWQGSNCPSCQKNKKKSKSDIIIEFKKIHSDKYDYSKVKYKNIMTKVEIICPEHGEFLQTPNDHKSGSGCPKCNKYGSLTEDIFFNKLEQLFGNKYNYSKTNFINTKKNIVVICPEHGEFLINAGKHYRGVGCIRCTHRKKLNTLEAIEDFKTVHLAKYDYSKVNYTNAKIPVEIICPEHGSFFQKPNNHKNGSGCPKCAQENSESKGERKVREFLESNNIKYSQEVKLFDNYRFDFYLEDLNTVIEYDGKQHFEPVEYFGGLEGFLKTQERDKIKTEYCLENNIRIIRIGYFEDVEEILKGLI
jgi:very-short-patch-repair endonuclease